ncbi:MAG: hypothetical protein HOP19_00095, partial [Acidobacteria bacterium]|nr:hypothetical protein [Acidobacteriota bacterium]
RLGVRLGLLVTAAGGLLTGYFGGFCGFVGLSWLALVIAHFCMKLEPQVQTLLGNTLLGVTSQELAKARDEAAAHVRQLEQQWDWDVNGRFVSKRNELMQHREHYASLEATRAERLQQLEAVARQDHVKAHLEQFEVQKSEVSGYVLTTFLRANGIRTAADVTPERVKATKLLPRAQQEILLGWRRRKEQLLTLDPDRLIDATLRHRVLTETEAMRERLEAELRSGALYLRRMRNEVEAAQLAVRDELLKAKQSLAQAEADFQTAGKRRTVIGWPVVVLLVAGMIGGILPVMNEMNEYNNTRKAIEGLQVTPSNDMNGKAREFFDEAMDYRKAKIYDRALTAFNDAHQADPVSKTIWDELSYTYYLDRQYDQAIKTASEAPSFGNTLKSSRNLGLAYAGKRDWADAKHHLETARDRLRRDQQMDREAVEVHFVLAQTFHALKEWPNVVGLASLESDASTSHLDESDRVLLVFYRLWSKGKALEDPSTPEISLHQDTYELMKEFFQRYQELNRKPVRKSKRR